MAEQGRARGTEGDTVASEAKEAAGDAAREARDTAEEVKERARRTSRQAKESAKRTAKEKTDELRHEARERVREVKDEAERQGDRWTSSLGRSTDRLAGALRAASDHLRGDDEAGMADVAVQAADQVERVGGYLEDEDPSGMLHDLEDLGRHNPATFLGTTFALGMLAGRFMRASRPSPSDGDPRAVRREGGGGDGRDATSPERRASPRSAPQYPADRSTAGPTAGSATGRRSREEGHEEVAR